MAFLESESDESYLSDGDSDSETSPINLSNLPSQSAPKKWDAFRDMPPEIEVGSMADRVWIARAEQLMLFLAYVLTFLVMLVAVIVGKSTTMFMISQVSPEDPRVLPYCNEFGDVNRNKDWEVNRNRTLFQEEVEGEQIRWVWALFAAFLVPEAMGFLRCLRVCVFKTVLVPRFLDFAFVSTMEILHAVGVAILLFLALPQMDSTHALALTNCLAFVPGLLLMLSRSKGEKMLWVKLPLDGFALLAQLSGALVWPLLQWTLPNDEASMMFPWAVPLGLILASCGWWEGFVSENSPLLPVRMMFNVRRRMIDGTRYFVYLWVTIFKGVAFFLAMWVIVSSNGVLSNYLNLFNMVDLGSATSVWVQPTSENVLGDNEALVSDAFQDDVPVRMETVSDVPLHLFIIQVCCTYAAYIFGKFACKVQIQGFSFSLPVSVAVPACSALILMACGLRGSDECAFHGWGVPDYLFFECPSVGDYLEYLWQEQMWLWIVWFLSQLWITSHIWYPKSPRLASTEEIFGSPSFSSAFVDQSLVLNRRRDGSNDISFDQILDDMQQDQMDDFYQRYMDDGPEKSGGGGGKLKSDIRASDKITKIYGCATMWHESTNEMVEMLKSIFRIDKDYSARRLAQKYLQIVDPDYYEWETHILFDDAFELGDNDEEEQIVNQFVKKLVSVMDEAGSYVHGEPIKVRPPKRYPTPYGGRIVWTLPGKTRIVCHLKDKSKIRHKKRWSQCMYMYYLLGYRLMELPISDARKDVIKENTYLLALDGDIDFQPEAITRLVDLMKKNKDVGAACGRIHPMGSGFMAWYQLFEYAIGHWLQKATEHVLGCVMCSPGCFSLFRGKALMDDNVMARYTTKSEAPRDYVQYDQGEDRWLCTLLLQRGWRVEYSAASDAFTAAPEGFNEFFNQRRRWMPSTIANIFDVLSDWKNVTSVNDNISIFYIGYQVVLMIGTVIGPGMIFLVIVGAVQVAFGVDLMTSLILNIIPIMAFILACFYLDSKIQLTFAQILSAIYALVMMAVVIGIFLQIAEEGWNNPNSLIFIILIGSFVLAAVLHPQEFWCLPYFMIYYVTIPSMYLLLVIYSFFNLNNVSWGTREVAKKKTKAELEEERKKEKDMKDAAKKQKKNDGGLLGFLMQKSGVAEEGGFEFSLANLFKCMCFTHEVQDDPKKQLIKIAASMDEVNTRLSKMEGGSGHAGFRRRSSLGRRGSGRTSLMKSALPEDVEDEALGVANTSVIEGLGGSLEESGSDYDSDDDFDRVQRDDLVNPYWIEDRDLGPGQIDYLPGVEVQFWKDLIEKYLEPLMADKAKEKQKANELLELRNQGDYDFLHIRSKSALNGMKSKSNIQMVFSFFMINAIFVVTLFLMQTNGEALSIPMPWGEKYNITYETSGTSTDIDAMVTVDVTYMMLEPIGTMLIILFGGIMIIQVIGMLFHRWGTMSQIISTTKFSICERKPKDMTEEGEIDKSAIGLAHVLQMPGKSEKKKKTLNRNNARRATVGDLLKSQQEKKKAKATDLESRFRNRLQSISPEEMEKSANPLMRRLSTRRDTMSALAMRRDSYFAGEERRNTVRFENRRASKVSINESHSPTDSDFGEDYSGSAYSFTSQHLEAVDDEETRDSYL